jgi:hypothetical protein
LNFFELFCSSLHDGDSIGCVVSFVEHRLYFTLNGRLLDDAVFFLPFDAVARNAPLYAVLGMHSRGSVVTARFAPPFRFDVSAFCVRLRQRVVHERIERLPDPAPQLVASLVADQLAWAGFADVLAAARQQLVPGVSPLPDASAASGELLAERQLVRRAILAGRFGDALQVLCAHNAPTDVRFDVACAAVAQTVLQGAAPGDVVAQTALHLQPLLLDPMLASSERMRRVALLERTVGLLAFPPGAARQRAADELAALLPVRDLAARANRALLPPQAARADTVVPGGVDNPAVAIAQALLPRVNDPDTRPTSAMEAVVRHRDVLLATLAAQGSAEAALLLNGLF